jgi:hypothetical protein
MKADTRDLLTRSRTEIESKLHSNSEDARRAAQLLGEIDAALRTGMPRIPFSDVPIGATFEWGDIEDPEWRRSYKKISDLVARRTDNGRNIWPAGDHLCIVIVAQVRAYLDAACSRRSCNNPLEFADDDLCGPCQEVAP